jgi:hypothetical protein
MHHRCPNCGKVTAFERRHRTFAERLRTWASTYRPHDCSECGKQMLLDVHYREAKDGWFGLWVVLGGLLLIGTFATVLLGVSPRAH